MLTAIVRIATVSAALTLIITLMPQRQAVAALPAHTFDSTNQGWTYAGANTDYGPPTLDVGEVTPWDNRGNPGGALSLGDVYYATWISAPAPFLGNHSDMYGQSFSYDIFIRYSDSTSFPYPTAAIRGNGITLLYTIATPPLFTWQTRGVTFKPELWTVDVGSGAPNPGQVATAAQLQSVLSNLEKLYLLTEWRTGPDDTSVDNLGTGFSIGLQGDYNQDGVVDQADYVVWRKSLGSVFSPTDYVIWRTNFGEPSSGSGGFYDGSPSQTAAPEPSALAMLVLPILACLARRPACNAATE